MADYDYISKYKSSSNTTYYLRTKAPGKNSLWWEGRDNALIASTSIPSGKYVPLLSTKSTNGSWEMGCYDNNESNYADSLIFSYISDTDYTNQTISPSTSGAVKLTNTGNIIIKNDASIGNEASIEGNITTKGNLIINNASKGIKVKDKSGASYNLICDNGTNLWIGAGQSSSAHHVGQTLISSGYSGTAGYKSIKIAVPNAANNGATEYQVFHEGYLDVGDTTDGVLGATYGGTGQDTLNKSANALINSLTTGSSTPVDDDYYVSQYVDGGTTTTTYHRRPVSALWTYIKGKADDVYLKLSGGKMTGNLAFQSSSLSAFSDAPSYILGIEPFADGGTVKYINKSNLCAGKDGSGNTITSTYLKLSGGALTGAVTSTSTLNLTRTTDAGLNTNAATLTIGPTDGVNLAFDNNEILARDNGAASTLYLNTGSAGLVSIGTGGLTTSGDITSASSIYAKYETNDTSGLKIQIKSKTYSFGMHMGTGGSNHGFYEWTSGGDGWLILRNGTTDAISTGFHAPLTGYYIRNISYGTSAPGSSAGSNGDVFIQYFS